MEIGFQNRMYIKKAKDLVLRVGYVKAAELIGVKPYKLKAMINSGHFLDSQKEKLNKLS